MLVENLETFRRLEEYTWIDNHNHNVLVVYRGDKDIAASNIKKVFNPFFTTKLGQGRGGLGLNIAYTLATGILGGSMSVASTEGAGGQFTLTLPLIAPHAPD